MASTPRASAMEPATEAPIQIAVVGDAGVGKTSILRTFSGEPFMTSLDPTTESWSVTRRMTIDDETVDVTLVDGTSKPAILQDRTEHYDNAAAVLIVYDPTRQETFKSVTRWQREARYLTSSRSYIVAVHAKSDLGDLSVLEEDPSAAVPAEDAGAELDVMQVADAVTWSKRTKIALTTVSARSPLLVKRLVQRAVRASWRARDDYAARTASKAEGVLVGVRFLPSPVVAMKHSEVSGALPGSAPWDAKQCVQFLLDNGISFGASEDAFFGDEQLAFLVASYRAQGPAKDRPACESIVRVMQTRGLKGPALTGEVVEQWFAASSKVVADINRLRMRVIQSVDEIARAKLAGKLRQAEDDKADGAGGGADDGSVSGGEDEDDLDFARLGEQPGAGGRAWAMRKAGQMRASDALKDLTTEGSGEEPTELTAQLFMRFWRAANNLDFTSHRWEQAAATAPGSGRLQTLGCLETLTTVEPRGRTFTQSIPWNVKVDILAQKELNVTAHMLRELKDLDAMTNMKRIYAADNFIMRVHINFANLTVLSLSNNRLVSLDYLPLPKLRVLELSLNRLRGPLPSAVNLGECPDLRVLALDDNLFYWGAEDRDRAVSYLAESTPRLENLKLDGNPFLFTPAHHEEGLYPKLRQSVVEALPRIRVIDDIRVAVPVRGIRSLFSRGRFQRLQAAEESEAWSRELKYAGEVEQRAARERAEQEAKQRMAAFREQFEAPMRQLVLRFDQMNLRRAFQQLRLRLQGPKVARDESYAALIRVCRKLEDLSKEPLEVALRRWRRAYLHSVQRGQFAAELRAEERRREEERISREREAAARAARERAEKEFARLEKERAERDAAEKARREEKMRRWRQHMIDSDEEEEEESPTKAPSRSVSAIRAGSHRVLSMSIFRRGRSNSPAPGNSRTMTMNDAALKTTAQRGRPMDRGAKRSPRRAGRDVEEGNEDGIEEGEEDDDDEEEKSAGGDDDAAETEPAGTRAADEGAAPSPRQREGSAPPAGRRAVVSELNGGAASGGQRGMSMVDRVRSLSPGRAIRTGSRATMFSRMFARRPSPAPAAAADDGAGSAAPRSVSPAAVVSASRAGRKWKMGKDGAGPPADSTTVGSGLSTRNSLASRMRSSVSPKPRAKTASGSDLAGSDASTGSPGGRGQRADTMAALPRAASPGMDGQGGGRRVASTSAAKEKKALERSRKAVRSAAALKKAGKGGSGKDAGAGGEESGKKSKAALDRSRKAVRSAAALKKAGKGGSGKDTGASEDRSGKKSKAALDRSRKAVRSASALRKGGAAVSHAVLPTQRPADEGAARAASEAALGQASASGTRAGEDEAAPPAEGQATGGDDVDAEEEKETEAGDDSGSERGSDGGSGSGSSSGSSSGSDSSSESDSDSDSASEPEAEESAEAASGAGGVEDGRGRLASVEEGSEEEEEAGSTSSEEAGIADDRSASGASVQGGDSGEGSGSGEESESDSNAEEADEASEASVAGDEDADEAVGVVGDASDGSSEAKDADSEVGEEEEETAEEEEERLEAEEEEIVDTLDDLVLAEDLGASLGPLTPEVRKLLRILDGKRKHEMEDLRDAKEEVEVTGIEGFAGLPSIRGQPSLPQTEDLLGKEGARCLWAAIGQPQPMLNPPPPPLAKEPSRVEAIRRALRLLVRTQMETAFQNKTYAFIKFVRHTEMRRAEQANMRALWMRTSAIGQRNYVDAANKQFVEEAKEMDRNVVQTASSEDAMGMGGVRAALERAKADARIWRLKYHDLRQKALEWDQQRDGTVFFGNEDLGDAIAKGAMDTPAFFWSLLGMGGDEEKAAPDSSSGTA